MNKKSKTVLNRIDRRNMTNTQKVLVQMLQNEGEWVARGTLRVPNATSRLRDLRKEFYGSFKVECRSSKELNRRSTTTYYRITNVKTEQLTVAFKSNRP